MSSEHHNAARKAEASASRAGLGKRVDPLPGGTGLRAALGDGLIGLGLIAGLMALFLGVFFFFRRDAAPTTAAAAGAPRAPERDATKGADRAPIASEHKVIAAAPSANNQATRLNGAKPTKTKPGETKPNATPSPTNQSASVGADKPPVDPGLIAAAPKSEVRPPPTPQPSPLPPPKLDFARDVASFFQGHCYDCHTGERAEAGLTLEKYKDEAAVTGNRQAFSKILKMLRGGLMPPPKDVKPPPKAETDRIVAWLDYKLNFVDCGLARDPGRVTIRRLNRNEYRNTIRDLLGVDFEGTKDFPADDVGYGFDNIGDVLSLPPLLMEKYLDAAEAIVAKTIVTDDLSKPTAKRYGVAQTQGGSAQLEELRGIYSLGEVWVEHAFPAAGEYTLRAQCSGDQAGDEPPKAEFRIDGRKVGVSDVKNRRDDPRAFEHKVQVPAGRHRFAVVFINDFYDPKSKNPRQRDRNLYVGSMEVVGPLGVKLRPPDAHTRLITATPTAGRTWDAAAREVLRNFARRAYRRPATEAEIERLVALARRGQKNGDTFEQSLALAVQAVLVSPHFLYRIELDPESSPPAPREERPAGDGAARDARHAERDGYNVRTLNEHELATRLSYFLWSSMPDDELFREAERGTLRTNLESQVRRMLRDGKSAALVENFVGQWLQLRNLYQISPDPKRFPAWNAGLRDDMRKETELFFAGIVREDRSVFELIDADYTFLNERLAKHYGIDRVSGNEFRRVSLTDRRRGGVLTQASVLSVTSSPTRTSPVKRGKWILEQILATEPPPPPANVEQLDEKKELTGTLRQRFEQHRSKPMCAVCHNQMDPLGFGFENYNAIGQWREKDGNFAVDSSGELPDGRKFNGPVELKRILLADDAKFRRCLAEKLLTYALGRGLEYYDRCAADDICQELRAGGDRFGSLVLAVVKSDPFQKRRGKTTK